MRAGGGGMSNKATWAMSPAEMEAEIERLRALLIDCIDSLEYVNRNHPEATGLWVRQERIEKARRALTVCVPANAKYVSYMCGGGGGSNSYMIRRASARKE